MNQNTIKDYFTLHGLTGFFIAVVVLLAIMGFLLTNGLMIQKAQSENFYSIDGDINKIKAIDMNNNKYYHLSK